MGYYSEFTLTWTRLETVKPAPTCMHGVRRGMNFCPHCGIAVAEICPRDQIQRWIEADQKKSNDNFYAIDLTGEPMTRETWYHYAKDMRRLSLAFPTVLFRLQIDGEENGDHRIVFFLNGKQQEGKAEIIYPLFDPTKLTEINL